MNRFCLTIFLSVFTVIAYSQNFTGQWKGEFIDKSTTFMGWGGDRCEYVLELDCKGTAVSGYSYTYFSDGDKRYYTICKLQGTIDKRSHSVEVREVERTKTNVPNNIRNCFQVHTLTYFKKDDQVTLEGTWAPAPNQEGDCGYGVTTLSKRIMKPNPLLAKKPVTKKPEVPVAKAPVIKTTKPPVKNNPVVKNTTPVKKPVTTVAKKPVPATPPVVKNTAKLKPVAAPVVTNKPVADEQKTTEVITPNKTPAMPVIAPGFEKRNSTLVRTIETENEVVKVDLYDNGDIDGDSVSLFFNGKLILSHQRLSDKAISLNLNVEQQQGLNELVMYADNLGTIPPNTALMIVTDGNKRYEVRITSDLQKSGSIMFLHRPKTGQ